MSRKIGLLTPAQPVDTPYASAHRYISKTVARMLIRQALVDVVGEHLVRERIKQAAPSITEIRHLTVAKPKVTHVHKLNAPSAPINLDLAYPEALRTSVVHPHHAMREACREARLRKAAESGN